MAITNSFAAVDPFCHKQKVYIVDRVESNPIQIANHPAWAAEYSLSNNQFRAMDIRTDTFCAGGSSLGDGRWVHVGGTGKVSKWDEDGSQSVRLISPCDDASCQWIEDPKNAMSTTRWYPSVEPMDDGSVIIIGGLHRAPAPSVNNPTYEFFPSRGLPVQLQFLKDTLPANMYPLTWLLPSGRVFVQANWGTMILDVKSGKETRLDNVPNAVRTYPASAATVLLPLTPDNGYSATILMCGGQNNNVWVQSKSLVNKAASNDCVRISPDGDAKWKGDATLPEGRVMGSFIILPDGNIWLGNGAKTGTSGYGSGSYLIGQSYARDPVLAPVVYDPSTRTFSRAGLGSSTIARMYHSSATLLPDGKSLFSALRIVPNADSPFHNNAYLSGSVFIAGSNPNGGVTDTTFATEYRTEKFYPWYYSNPRPQPISGLPDRLGYGGNYFDVRVARGAGLQGLAPVVAAGKTKVVIIRTGFSTHAMNMGQRYLQLDSTANANADGSITIHVSQVPPNPALFAPGTAFLYVVVNGVPSIGKRVIVGNGIGKQVAKAPQRLPRP
ncbi:glyoxal oxidase N-terminus-domain-containing protein [Cantharellus anzutake]|uniref:glyoxal oxidase N-terminus-domain-containing protein n=1 Tax=Cantharellus anzutake TaxID=1750568 RepID=UPI00190804DC|nr:glyoxal oxidase N-terminus-domain-containing protein [Cantharellus anzutake]KAF8334888.1 glyoxal oxidase N-terminus-domain-containing protein [Cantharellus anzutake]